MSEGKEFKVTTDETVASWSIAQTAEFELWQRGRDDARRRLRSAVTWGFVYLIAALAVGAYLIVVVKEISRGTVWVDSWNFEEMDLSWMTQIAWGYAGLAVLAIIAYPLLLLLIHGKLPSGLAWFMRRVPGIGSTMRVVELGELCQSMVQSIAQSKTYAAALGDVSHTVRDSGLRRWSARAHQQIEAGQSLATLLRSSPIHDQPLPAVIAFAQSDTSRTDTLRVWQQAAAQCHIRIERRVDRATQAVSVSCLLAAVFFAAFGLLLAATITCMALDVWIYWGAINRPWFAPAFESPITMLPVAIGSLLLACMIHSIVANLNEHPSARPLRVAITFLKTIQWLLWTVGILALIVAVPHPITVVLVAMFVASIVIAARWRYREEVESLNDWLRLAAETTVSIPMFVERMADGFHSRLAGQSRAFAARVNRGEGIVDAVRRSKLPVQSDTLAAILMPRIDAAEEQADGGSGVDCERDEIDARLIESPDLPPIVSEQFVYVIATVFLAWLISIQVRSIILPIFKQMLDEFSTEPFKTPGLDFTVTAGNVITFFVAIWLLAALLTRWLPLWMVPWIPWFGRRSIDRWRCQVLRALERGVRRKQPAGEIMQFARDTTRVQWIHRRTDTASRLVESGSELAPSLRKAKLISSREQTWLSSAEKNGALADTIQQIIDNIRRRQTLIWTVRKSWLVPLATIAVGLYVLVHGVVVFQVLSRLMGGIA